MSRRQFTALLEERCAWAVTLRDGSKAQCRRRKVNEHFCNQHIYMAVAWSCEYCGGNDEPQPDHCMDCSRPSKATS